MEIILASTSPYRRELLAKLQIPFSIFAPNIDEKAQTGESPEQLTRRLAIDKAKAYLKNYSTDQIKTLAPSLIIASDQVMSLNGEIFGKPHTTENAKEQLNKLSNNIAYFYTALAVLKLPNSEIISEITTIEVKFRKLSHLMIEKYLEKEHALDCAGAAKSEGLGISLIEYIHCDDPNALIGLPLISLINIFERFGYSPLTV